MNKTLIQNEKAIVNLKFKTTLPLEDLEKVSSERKRILKKTRGLVSLHCYVNDETKTFGGIFMFEDIRFANQYLENFLTEGMGPKYGIIAKTLKIDIGAVKYKIDGENLDSYGNIME